jgi:hypothetical protein
MIKRFEWKKALKLFCCVGRGLSRGKGLDLQAQKNKILLLTMLNHLALLGDYSENSLDDILMSEKYCSKMEQKDATEQTPAGYPHQVCTYTLCQVIFVI